MNNINNPLRQYFRRPALYITLPSKGKSYPQGSLDLPENGELPVYPMTAIDEITAKTPDALFNGSAVVELIKSCVPAIKNPWVIPSSDLDTILIAIRAATNGNTLEIESTCMNCEEISSYTIDLVKLLSQIDCSGYNNPLQVGELMIKFNPLTFKTVNQGNVEQFEIQRSINQLENIENQEERTRQSTILLKRLTDMNINLVANTIESIAVPNEVVTNKEYIVEFLKGCNKNLFEDIRQQVIKLRDDSNIKPLDVRCAHCQHEYKQPIALNPTDFFE